MFIITSGTKATESVQYFMVQPNGVKVLCESYESQYIYSNDTDTSYPASTHKCHIVDNIPTCDNICEDYEYDGVEFIPSSYNKLKDENKLLKQQVSLLSDNNTFLEDCLIEMASEVYQ